MKHYLKTDVGVVRKENQDRVAIFQKENQTFVILCDGMGGHNGGSHASSITIDIFEKAFQKPIPAKKIISWFEKTTNKAKKEMSKFSNGDKKLLDMGTTLTAALITEGEIYIFNIGDSRTYMFNGLLHQITTDHNLRNYYIDKYGYTPEEAARVTGAAALTSALGPKKRATVDTLTIENNDIKYIILTSDGVHDYIAKPTFENILNKDEDIDRKAIEIIKQAIRGKSSDNLTIAIIELDGQ